MRECILASASPRRRELLERLGVKFEVFVPDVDEQSDERDPERLSVELSARKGRAAHRLLTAAGRELSGRLLIASDTVVAAVELAESVTVPSPLMKSPFVCGDWVSRSIAF